jgi:hypothetical protein
VKNKGRDDEEREMPLAGGTTFQDNLKAQLSGCATSTSAPSCSPSTSSATWTRTATCAATWTPS